MPQKAGSFKATQTTERVVGQTPDGQYVTQITLVADGGLTAVWLTYGATLQKLILPDGTNVVAGFDDPMDYLGPHPYLGSTVGPIANRVSRAQFSVDGVDYRIPANEGENSLHSGPHGYDRQVWDHRIGDDGSLELSLFSADRGRGFPSDSWAFHQIDLEPGALHMTLDCDVHFPAPINATVHPYFNPTGRFDVPVDDLTLWSPASHFSVVDDMQIPTGELAPLQGSKMDLSSHAAIGARQIDHNYIVPGGPGQRLLATLTDETRYIFVHANMPGLQVFTGESLADVPGMVARGAVALEPQYPPDLINHPVKNLDGIFTRKRGFANDMTIRLAGPGLPEL